MDEIKLPRFWVSQPFRRFMSEKYNLQRRADFQLAQWLLISGMRDGNDHNRTVVPHEVIEALYGANTPLEQTLQDFEKHTGMELRVEIGSRWDGRATTVSPLLDSETVALFRAEADSRRRNKVEKVDFVSGERWTAYKEKKWFAEQAAAMESYAAPGHPAEALIKYLHSPRVRKAQMALVTDNDDAVVREIDEIVNPMRYQMANRTWVALKGNYQAYKTAKNSDRIYGESINLLQLPREVRKRVFGGCYSVDLRYCQLCIVAKLWDLPIIGEFLATGESLWARLLSDLGVGPSRKDELKRILYMLVYGAGRKAMKEKSDLTDLFMEHPFAQEILENRRKAMEQIANDRGMADAFGRWIDIGDVEDKRYEQERVRSLLARQVQSYEVLIMLAAFDTIQADKDMILIGWVHDGIYVQITHHADRADAKMKAIAEALADRGEQLHMQATAEIEEIRKTG